MEEIWSSVFLYRVGISYNVWALAQVPFHFRKKSQINLFLRWGESKHLLKWSHWGLPPVWICQKKIKKKRMDFIWTHFILFLFCSIVEHCWNSLMSEKSSSVNYKSLAWNCKLHQDGQNEKSQRRRLQSLIRLLVTFCIFLWLFSKSDYILHFSSTEKGFLLDHVLLGSFWENLYILIGPTDFL